MLELEAALGRAHLRIQELEKALYRPNAASQMSAASSGNSGLNTSSDSSEEGAVTLLIGDEPHLGQSPAAGDGQETAVVEFQLNGSGEKI